MAIRCLLILSFLLTMVLCRNDKVSFYFFEWLTNVYKRSFVEMHMKFCNMVNYDVFFGTAFRNANITCPVLPGEYELSNCTIPSAAIPKSFPFTKGRIYLNATYTPTNELVSHSHVDFELRQMRKKN